MSWLYKYFRLVMGETYPILRLHDATLQLSGTGATLRLASGATVNEFSTDGTLAGDSDTAVPTEKAIKAYVDASPAGAVTLAGVQSLTNKNIDFAGATGRADTGLTIFSYGTMDVPKTITSTADIVPFQMYMQSTTDSLAGSSLINAYLKTENTTIDQPTPISSRLAPVMLASASEHGVSPSPPGGRHAGPNSATDCPALNANTRSTAYSGRTAMKASTAMASPAEMSSCATSAAQESMNAAPTMASPRSSAAAGWLSST